AVTGNRHINLMWDLRGEFVVCKGGDEADNPLRNLECDCHKVWVTKRSSVSEPVETTAELFDDASVSHRVKRSPVNTCFYRLCHAQDTTVFSKGGFRLEDA